MFKRSWLHVTVGIGLGLAIAMLVWLPNAFADEKEPPILKSAVVSFEKASVHQGDWGEMRIFFRGETFGTKDAFAATAVVKPGEAVHRAHRHAEEEYLFLNEGEGVWNLAGKEFPAHQGDVLYVEPWVFHGLTNTGKKPLTFTVIKFNGKGVSLPPRPDDRKDEL